MAEPRMSLEERIDKLKKIKREYSLYLSAANKASEKKMYKELVDALSDAIEECKAKMMAKGE